MIFFGKDRGSRNDQSSFGGHGNFSGKRFPQEKAAFAGGWVKTCTRRVVGSAAREILRISRPETVLAARAFTRASDTAWPKFHLVDVFRLNPQPHFETILRNHFDHQVSPAGTMAPSCAEIL